MLVRVLERVSFGLPPFLAPRRSMNGVLCASEPPEAL